VKQLPDTIDGAKIIKKQMPVSFETTEKDLNKYIQEYNPDIILAVGEAGGRTGVSIERVAINVDDARIPDNDNKQPINKKITADGENAYFSTLPIYKIAKYSDSKGAPIYISNSAGTYVCNHTMYYLLELLKNKYPNKIGGFVHVPNSPSQVIGKNNAPSTSTQDTTKALENAIHVSLGSLKN
jgi:pyroglutamyl-peptidase